MTTSASSNLPTAAAFLRTASRGFCEYTAPGEGDCDAGTLGSWVLTKEQTLTDEAAAQGCLSRCAACARCAYITVNRATSDCSWYASCNLARLHDPRNAFLSGRVRQQVLAPPPLRR